VEPDELAAYWLERIEQLLRASVRDLDLVPPAQRVEVEFGRFMADEMGTVEQILAAAGLPPDEDARRQVDLHRESHPRGLGGRIVYDLRADFGLEPDVVRRHFDFYFERFPQVRAEVD
jgi:hypothetical protein